MPNKDKKGTHKERSSKLRSLGRYSVPWKPPAWLEKGFFYVFFVVALFATVVLIFWSVITFCIPFQVYSIETEPTQLTNGQTLRVIYPNLILGNDESVEIKLILAGELNGAQATFTIDVPPGLTVTKPKAYGTQLELNSSGSGSNAEPEEMAISLVNTRSEPGPVLLVRRRVVISSPLMQDPESIDIGVETIPWIAAQAIVHDPANERNALILFIASLLSGAGTLILQFMKRYQDRFLEDLEKRKNEFRDQLKESPVDALDGFSKLERDDAEDSDFSIKKKLVEAFGWEDKLQQTVLERLKSRDHYFDAKRAAEVLNAVCLVFVDSQGQACNFCHSRSLFPFCELVCEDDRKNHLLSREEAQCLLDVHKRWPELKPLVVDLIHDFVSLCENLPVFFEKFRSEQGRQLLRDANVYEIIYNLMVKLEKDIKNVP